MNRKKAKTVLVQLSVWTATIGLLQGLILLAGTVAGLWTHHGS